MPHLANLLEWYDFGSYSYLTIYISEAFFPSSDTSALLVTFFAFAFSFLFRPLGASIFGHIGDRYGRIKSLKIVYLLMVFSTVMLGALPNFNCIGNWSTILLFLARGLQGFSLGGQYSGALTHISEAALPSRRAFSTGIVWAFASFGFLLAGIVSFIILNIPILKNLSWSWRIPFLLSIIPGIFIITEIFNTKEQFSNNKPSNTIPIKEAFSTHWKVIVLLILMAAADNTFFYTLFTFLISFLKKQLGYTEIQVLLLNIISLLTLCILVPLAGYLSDKQKQHTLLPFIGGLGLLIFSIPCLYALLSHNMILVIIAMMILVIFQSMYSGPCSAIYVESFPRRIRFSGSSIAYNFGLIISGLAPAIITNLLLHTKLLLMPGYYLMLFSIIGCSTVYTLYRYNLT